MRLPVRFPAGEALKYGAGVRAPMEPPRELDHLLLFVRNLSAARAFYQDVLGFRLIAADSDEARFDLTDTELVLRADPPFADSDYRDFINQLKGNMRGMGSAFHFAVGDVDAYFARLTAKGVVPIDPLKNRRLDAPVANANGRREFAIEDPDGYWLFFVGGA